jgi:hypothetical protein
MTDSLVMYAISALDAYNEQPAYAQFKIALNSRLPNGVASRSW